MRWKAGCAYLSARYVSIGIRGELEEVRENREGYVSYPVCFDEMGPCIEIVMEGNLDKVPGEMGTARHQDLFERQSQEQ